MMYSIRGGGGGGSSTAASIIRRSITTITTRRNVNYVGYTHKHHYSFHRASSLLLSYHHPSSIHCFSTTTTTTISTENNENETNGTDKKLVEKMRIAIVGGGTAGLSTALHLAPLVSRGIIEGPVDVYECSSPNSPHPIKNNNKIKDELKDESQTKKKKNVKTEADWPNEYPGSGPTGRSIGVGIWSTALAPFRTSHHPSHAQLLHALESSGSYVGRVGYRTPNGKWLARSELDTDGGCHKQPALLFLPERDLLTCLKDAVKLEEELGTIRTHYGPSPPPPDEKKEAGATCVESIHIPPNSIHPLGRLAFSNGTLSPPSTPYHLIVAADGMHSKLRSHYAGHFFKKTSSIRRRTTTSRNNNNNNNNAVISQDRVDDWDESDQEEKNAVEDRQYSVFRGCSSLTSEEMGCDGYSFQTWGEGDSMRFAVVSMVHPTTTTRNSTSSSDEEEEAKKTQKEEQVWFITTSDTTISSEKDPTKRRELLIQKFKNWHDPIGRLLESTSPNDILMERALAHRHSVGPVFNVAEIALHECELMERRRNQRMNRHLDIFGGAGDKGKNTSTVSDKVGADRDLSALKESPNLGPALFFVGDANMTVDPVLAQGLTMAMEGGHALANSVERCCLSSSTTTSATNAIINNNESEDYERITPLNFDPFELRTELRHQHRKLGARLLCLLRATEMVQTLAQPHSALSGFLFKGVIRPAMRLPPDFVKKPIFDYMMRYSLGLTGEDVVVSQTTSVRESGASSEKKER